MDFEELDNLILRATKNIEQASNRRELACCYSMRAYWYSCRGLFYGIKKDIDVAIADFEKSIKLEPSWWAYTYGGDCYFFIGDDVKGKEYHKRAAEVSILT